MDPQPLTERQRKIVEFIVAFTAEHGYPPSGSEIGRAVGLSSRSSVAYQLGELQRLGRLQRDKNVTRGIRVVHLEAVDET